MRRAVVSCVIVVGCGLACVSDQLVNQTAEAKLVRPRQSRRAYRSPPLRPTRRSNPIEVAAWYPRGHRISPRWTHVVLHHSATPRGGAKRFDKFHRQKNGWDELGYHFVIGNGTDTADGYVEVGPRWWKQKHGAHCKTSDNYYNEHGIGVCLVGDFTKTRPTRRQLASLNRLVRFLSDQCDISPYRITTHRAVTGRSECPGDGLRLTGVRKVLSSSTAATAMP